MFLVLPAKALADHNLHQQGQYALVELTFVASQPELLLLEQKQAVAGADFLGLGDYSCDFGVDEFGHDDLARCEFNYFLPDVNLSF